MKHLFDLAYDFAQFIQESEPEVIEKVEKVRALTQQFRGDYTGLNAIQERLRILAFAENTCPDSVLNLTILDEIIQESLGIELKILPMDAHEDEIAQHTPDGDVRIPILLFLNKEYKVKSTFVEFPRVYIFKQNMNPEDQSLFEDYRNGAFIAQTIQEFLSAIENCL